MNYKIIVNEQLLKEFIDWLPTLQPNEKYYVSLFARKKYSALIKSNDKTQLKRFVSNKERLFDKIKQLECEVGAYKVKNGVAPQESLVLYITPNPRDMLKATFQVAKKSIDLIETQGQNYNIHAEALSCIQRSKSKSYFCDFDVDDTSVDIFQIKDILPEGTYRVLKTKGGYHILVNTRTAPTDIKWHKIIRETFKVDVVGDQLLPVVGCVQGNFVPSWLIK